MFLSVRTTTGSRTRDTIAVRARLDQSAELPEAPQEGAYKWCVQPLEAGPGTPLLFELIRTNRLNFLRRIQVLLSVRATTGGRDPGHHCCSNSSGLIS